MQQDRIDQMHETYMRSAELWADMSRGIRAKVGAVLVTQSGVVLTGFNGTPPGADNALEDIDRETGEFVTKPNVIHAEMNCILKAAREGVSVIGARVYVTHSPCEQCAAVLASAGVSAVYYRQIYKNDNGIRALSGIFTKLLVRKNNV